MVRKMGKNRLHDLRLEWSRESHQSLRQRYLKPVIHTVALLSILTIFWCRFAGHFQTSRHIPSHRFYEPKCPPQEIISPKLHPEITEQNVEKLFKSEEFHKLSVERLAGAVKIPSEDFDDMGEVGEDKRWDVFFDIEDYFRQTFPLLYEYLTFEKINTHGLIYTWHGSNPHLKPILLTGHQDVVPVAEDTLPQWTYPPFSGHYDGTYINGRGSHDCKNNVLAILSSINALLSAGFTPQRTVILAFGFDEESPRGYGAKRIAAHLLEKYGKDSFAILLDEGLMGINKMYNRTFGVPQTSEKGSVDAILKVHMPGGHSSMAPPHTSIGILSKAITLLEDSARKNFPSRYTERNPFWTQLHCVAETEGTDMSRELRNAVLSGDGKAVEELLRKDFKSDILLRTSQAVDIFKAGSKSNALPQFAEAIVNYRISNEDTVSAVQSAIVNTLKPMLKEYGLKMVVGDEEDNSTAILPEGSISINWWRKLEPSPVSSHKSEVWRYFSGVIKHVFDEPGEESSVIVAPTIAQGNTDTKYFWDLTPQIYRFGPVRAWHDEGWGGVHDVNERISLEAHLECILFYHEFIRVFDEAKL
ncbi:hypothetical protein BGZ60DRAFT_223907 [Tricladium varicosporioides]|nr:hypothetical protein BGZ60DRAFT_223907 [Hymenoscyphus varicosporioides]